MRSKLFLALPALSLSLVLSGCPAATWTPNSTTPGIVCETPDNGQVTPDPIATSTNPDGSNNGGSSGNGNHGGSSNGSNDYLPSDTYDNGVDRDDNGTRNPGGENAGNENQNGGEGRTPLHRSHPPKARGRGA